MSYEYKFQYNLNGDSADTLLRNFRDSAESMSLAIDQMIQTRPHGRNYQVNTDPTD